MGKNRMLWGLLRCDEAVFGNIKRELLRQVKRGNVVQKLSITSLVLATAICGLFCGCTTSDECSVYDDAIKTMFFYSVNDNRLYEQYGQSIGDYIPYDESDEESIEISFTLDDDTICRSSGYDVGTWAIVNIENHYSYPSIVKYTCRAGEYCHKLKSSKRHELKINVIKNNSLGKEQYAESIEVKYNYAYGFFLERDMEQIQKSSDSDIDFSNKKCVNGICMFSYKKNNGVCKRGALGDECFIEP